MLRDEIISSNFAQEIQKIEMGISENFWILSARIIDTKQNQYIAASKKQTVLRFFAGEFSWF